MDDALSMVMKAGIKVISPSITQQDGRIIIRGLLDNNYLSNINTPDYQRELVKNRVYWGLVNTFSKQDISADRNKNTCVPDVTLACRGSKQYRKNSQSVVLPDGKVFLVDGLQRISALLHAQELHLEHSSNPFQAQLGCIIHMDTTIEFEREMFKNLNTNHTSVAADVILREYRHTSEPARAIFDWCSMEGSAPISKFICWQQTMNKSHLLRANSIFRTANTLMARFAGSGGVTKTADLINMAETQFRAVGGVVNYMHNLNTYYEALEEAFRLTNPEQRVPNSLHLLPHLAFADLMAKHDDFWDNSGLRLKVPKSILPKISTFTFTMENVRALMSSTKSSSVTMLRTLMVEHIDKGKQPENRLRFTRP